MPQNVLLANLNSSKKVILNVLLALNSVLIAQPPPVTLVTLDMSNSLLPLPPPLLPNSALNVLTIVKLAQSLQRENKPVLYVTPTIT